MSRNYQEYQCFDTQEDKGALHLVKSYTPYGERERERKSAETHESPPRPGGHNEGTCPTAPAEAVETTSLGHIKPQNLSFL